MGVEQSRFGRSAQCPVCLPQTCPECPTCPPPVKCPPPVECPKCPDVPPPEAPKTADYDEITVYNNLADALISGEPQMTDIVLTYVPLSSLEAAKTYLRENRAEAIVVAQELGFAKKGSRGNVSADLARWIRKLAHKQNPDAFPAASVVEVVQQNRQAILGLVLIALAAALALYMQRSRK